MYVILSIHECILVCFGIQSQQQIIHLPHLYQIYFEWLSVHRHLLGPPFDFQSHQDTGEEIPLSNIEET